MKRAFFVLAAAASSRRAAAGIPGQTRVTGGTDSEREFFAPLLLANVSDAELSVEPALTATQDGDILRAAGSVRLQSGEIRTAELGSASGPADQRGLLGRSVL